MAQTCYAWIIIAGLLKICFNVFVHGAKLQAIKGFPKPAHTTLSEENRASAVNQNQNGDDGNQPG